MSVVQVGFRCALLASTTVVLSGCEEVHYLACSAGSVELEATAGSWVVFEPSCNWFDGRGQVSPSSQTEIGTALNPEITLHTSFEWLTVTTPIASPTKIELEVREFAPPGKHLIYYSVNYYVPTSACSNADESDREAVCDVAESVRHPSDIQMSPRVGVYPAIEITVELPDDSHKVEVMGAPIPYLLMLNGASVDHCVHSRDSCTLSAPNISTLAFTVPSAPSNCTWTCGNEELPCSAATFTITEDVTCTMKAPTQQLTYGTTGDGSGQVDVYIDGTQFIGCDGQCDLPKDKQIELRASQSAGSDFRGWTGDCAGLGPNATIVLDADKSCTAEFAQNTAMDTLVVELLNADGMNIELFAEDNTPLTQQGSEYTTSVPHMTEVPLAVRTVGDVTIDFSVAWACGTTLSTTGHNVSIPVNGPTRCTATIEREERCTGTPTPIMLALTVSQDGAEIDRDPTIRDIATYLVFSGSDVNLDSSATGGDGPLQVRWVLPSQTAIGPSYSWPNRFITENDTHRFEMVVEDACGQTESLLFDIIGG